MILSSSKGGAITWIPTGSPRLSKPPVIEIAGRPARLTAMVKRSERYIRRGSAIREPISKAVVGEVGIKTHSQRSKA